MTDQPFLTPPPLGPRQQPAWFANTIQWHGLAFAWPGVARERLQRCLVEVDIALAQHGAPLSFSNADPCDASRRVRSHAFDACTAAERLVTSAKLEMHNHLVLFDEWYDDGGDGWSLEGFFDPFFGEGCHLHLLTIGDGFVALVSEQGFWWKSFTEAGPGHCVETAASLEVATRHSPRNLCDVAWFSASVSEETPEDTSIPKAGDWMRTQGLPLGSCASDDEHETSDELEAAPAASLTQPAAV